MTWNEVKEKVETILSELGKTEEEVDFAIGYSEFYKNQHKYPLTNPTITWLKKLDVRQLEHEAEKAFDENHIPICGVYVKELWCGYNDGEFGYDGCAYNKLKYKSGFYKKTCIILD